MSLAKDAYKCRPYLRRRLPDPGRKCLCWWKRISESIVQDSQFVRTTRSLVHYNCGCHVKIPTHAWRGARNGGGANVRLATTTTAVSDDLDKVRQHSLVFGHESCHRCSSCAHRFAAPSVQFCTSQSICLEFRGCNRQVYVQIMVHRGHSPSKARGWAGAACNDRSTCTQ
jgi:hypothetical protein